MVPHSHIALMDEPGNVNLDDNEDEEQLNNPEDVWESFNEVVQEAVANEEMLLLEQEGQVNKGDDKEEDNDGGDEDITRVSSDGACELKWNHLISGAPIGAFEIQVVPLNFRRADRRVRN